MRRGTVIPIVMAILLIGLGYWGCASYPTPEPAATPPPEEEKQVTRVVSATGVVSLGVVVPAQWATLSFEMGGRVEEVMVEAGDPVQGGQPLIQLHTTDLEHSLSQAQASLAAAQADLARLEAGPTPQEIAVAEAAVEAASAELDLLLRGAHQEEITAAQMALAKAEAAVSLAQAEYDKVAWNPGIGATPQGVALQRATSNYEIAKANYEALLRGPSEEEIDVAQAGLKQAQAQLDLLRAGATLEEIRGAQARVDEAKAVVAQAEAGLEKATLRAPFGGTIGVVTTRKGELVSPGQAVIVIGDLRHLRIETTDLSEIDIPLVRVGQEVRVTFDALPERILVGRVAQIATMAEITTEGTNYTVIVELREEDSDLRWGMTAFVVIVAD